MSDWVTTLKRIMNFEANCSNFVLRVLKSLCCLHELCVAATAAAPAADPADKQAKSTPIVFITPACSCPFHLPLGFMVTSINLYHIIGSKTGWTCMKESRIIHVSPLWQKTHLFTPSLCEDPSFVRGQNASLCNRNHYILEWRLRLSMGKG